MTTISTATPIAMRGFDRGLLGGGGGGGGVSEGGGGAVVAGASLAVGSLMTSGSSRGDTW
jgi:hypothetical protein